MIGRLRRKPISRSTQATFRNGGSPVLCWLGLIVSAVVPVLAEPVTIHWQTEQPPLSVEVRGLTSEQLAVFSSVATSAPDWKNVFPVFAEQGSDHVASAVTMPPMIGRWSAAAGRLRFEPRFPLVRGVRYRAEFRPAGGAPVISFFELPADNVSPTTRVVQIFPTTNRLPENQLKFYVQFSAPMSRGGSYANIRLREAGGAVAELAFLELDEELWDPTMTRLTLLIDPGRIKRGVKPLEDVGSVFEAGKTYSLTIDPACRDAEGRPLRAAFEKTFQVVEADRTAPDPARWKVIAPSAGTRDPLVVEFDEPMDQALALRLIDVVAEGRSTSLAPAGQSALGSQEKSWSFVPADPWARGAYRVTVHTTIEDLAGNNIGKPFDVDVAAEPQRRFTSERVGVPFVVR